MDEMRQKKDFGETPPRDASSTDEPSEARGSGRDLDEEEVRRRAYDRYLERGEVSGDAVDDWLAAESDVRRKREDQPE